MTSLALAAALYVGAHFSASTPLRGAVVARVGLGPWAGLYSLVALATFVWMILAWRAAPMMPAPFGAPWARHLPEAVMPFALWFFVASLTTPNPTLMGREELLRGEPPVEGVLRITRHPMLWGFALFGLVHMLANPDLGAWIFFGTFVVLGVVGAFLLDAKKARAYPEAFASLARRTSNVPFGAIVRGVQRFPTDRRFWLQGLAAVALYVALGLLHPWLFGVRAFGG